MKLLDALDPDTLQQLYADVLAGFWDDDAYRSAQDREDAQRDALRSAAGRLPDGG